MLRYWIEKLDKINRFKFFSWVIFILFCILGLRLFQLTIIQGSYWRAQSENKRAKSLVLTAPRGEIRDRKGLLIAGNKPVFTVELRKDELDKMDLEDKNRDFLKLTRFLREDGANVTDDFPLILNHIDYKTIAAERQADKSAMETFIQALLDQDLLGDLLDLKGKYSSGSRKDVYYLGQEVLLALGQDQAPIVFHNRGPDLMTYKSPEDQAAFLASLNLEGNLSPKEALLSQIKDNPTLLKKVFANPMARKLAFDLLDRKGGVGSLTCRPLTNQYDLDLKESKLAKMDLYPEVSLNSSAEEDFLTIFAAQGAQKLLSAPVKEDQAGEKFVKILKKEKGRGQEIDYREEGKKPVYTFKNGKSALPYLQRKTRNKKLLRLWLEDPEVRTRAQKILADQGIYPGISLADEDYQYVALKNKKDFYKANQIPEKASEEEAFQALLDKRKIDKNLSIYDQRAILNIYYELTKQGNLAYLPIHLAYKIKEKTVAQISEHFSENPGIDVQSQPIRSYPLGKSAAHILGYMGKISSDQEIKDYLKKGYERDSIVGKTGLEESFEPYLHGQNGQQKVQVDAKGNTTEVLKEIPPVPGKNLYLSIDLDVQQRAEKALADSLRLIQKGGTYESPWGNFNFLSSKEKGRPYVHANSGAVIAVDTRTGKILAMANYPSYDPNLFATGISSVDWESLIPLEEKNPLAPRPLYNIPLQTAVQPGSIFKMITGLSALDKGLDPDMTIPDGGYVDIGGSVFGCWLWNQNRETHGDESLKDAIRDSCNYYFYSLGLGKDQRREEDLGIQIDVDDIRAMAEKFGLGEKTGVEIKTPQEAKSILPDKKQKAETMKQLLRNFLNRELDKASQETLTEEKKNGMIEKLVAFADRKEPISRQELFEEMTKMGLDPNTYLVKERTALGDYMLYNFYNQTQWGLADTMNVTIGQGNNAYTLAQMARYTMALANGGKLYPLSLVQEVKDQTNEKTLMAPQAKGKQIDFKRDGAIEEVVKGMQMAALANGNQNCYKDFPVEVAIKTGTAERAGTNPYTGETYDSFSWQVGFAPYDDPEIAVAAVFFQGGSGMNCGPLIREVMAEYFGLNKEVVTETLPIEDRWMP